MSGKNKNKKKDVLKAKPKAVQGKSLGSQAEDSGLTGQIEALRLEHSQMRDFIRTKVEVNKMPTHIRNIVLAEQTTTSISQPFPLLLQLPREIRDQIFILLFQNTRVSFGNRSIGIVKCKVIKPAAHALAILRVCRQIHQETKKQWLCNILFSFERPEAMMDKLSALPPTILSQIRHVRTTGHLVMMTPLNEECICDDDAVYYRLAPVLKLLPGLQLDTLTVLGPRNGDIAYDVLTGLVERGNGWKELRFINSNSHILGFARLELFMDDHRYWRKPQPSSWAATMRTRDGADSGASVTVYQSKEANVVGRVQNPLARIGYKQKPTKNLQAFGITAEQTLMHSQKEMMIVVKRGSGARFVEESKPPFGAEDIRIWSRDMPWMEIKKKCIDYEPDDLELEDGFDWGLIQEIP